MFISNVFLSLFRKCLGSLKDLVKMDGRDRSQDGSHHGGHYRSAHHGSTWEYMATWEHMGALWEYHGSTIGPPVSTMGATMLESLQMESIFCNSN